MKIDFILVCDGHRVKRAPLKNKRYCHALTRIAGKRYIVSLNAADDPLLQEWNAQQSGDILASIIADLSLLARQSFCVQIYLKLPHCTAMKALMRFGRNHENEPPYWNRDAADPIIAGDDIITDLSDPSVLYDNHQFRMWMSCIEIVPGVSDKSLWPAHVCYSQSADGWHWSAAEIVFSPSATLEKWDGQKAEIPAVIKDDTEADSAKRYKM